ncbi:arginine--tRNA ligase [bacterium]|nr:arginine--tRNA ligase [bacterium]
MPQVRDALATALEKEGVQDPQFTLEHTADFAHGDYASSVALAYAKQLNTNPRSLAEKLVASMGNIEGVSKIEIAGPGFINFTLEAKFLFEMLKIGLAHGDAWGRSMQLQGKKVMVEYTDPNPFKAFHIGHLMSNTIGESLARLQEAAGAEVIRANYQGDLGVHVACAIWGIKKLGIHPTNADEFGRAYAEGATAYKENAEAKTEIDAINKKLYDQSDAELNELYDTGRTESLEAFERIYAILGTKFDHYFFESETGPIGKKIVESNPAVFPESEGARVFKGEEHGLHTRVFLNSQGLPTYEAKELGLEKLKTELYPDAETLYIVTANEVVDFFRVVKKAMEIVHPEIAAKLTHVSHGMMKLPEGKMSSRTGNVVTGESLIKDLAEVAKERAAESRADDKEKLAQDIAVAAIKFQILKGSTGKDIIFERERALSVEGDSGPYLQYTHARTHAIVEKAKDSGVEAAFDPAASVPELARLIFRFYDVVKRSRAELEPHHVTNYLIAVAAAFNSWYAQEQILDGTPAAAHKVALTDITRLTLKNGLWLLGIPTPEKV